MKRIPRLSCLKEYQELMKLYHEDRTHPEEGSLVAYVTSGAPVEILDAFGFITVYPENYGAQCGVQKLSTGLCESAEAEGYAGDLCAYAKGHLASSLNPGTGIPDALPEPDFLLCCTNICGTVLPWYEHLAEIHKCPLFIIDVPFIFSSDDVPGAVSYVADQMKECIGVLEKLTGKKMDYALLSGIIMRSKEAIRLWTEIRECGKAVPSPVHVPDLFLTMAPIVVMRSSQGTIDFYRSMLKELRDRIAGGVSAVGGEKFRLLWDNIAVWVDIFRFYRFFAEQGACFVGDTYTGSWSQELNADNPVQGLAEAYTTPYINLNADIRVGVIDSMRHDFSAQGIIYHANRSCKPFSLTQRIIRKQIMETDFIPSLELDTDMCDERLYSRASIQERCLAFMELLSQQ